MVMARPDREQGWLALELMIGLGILVMALLPLGYSFVHEAKSCRAYYYRAAAIELVDSELEVLAAGSYRRYSPGTHDYVIGGAAAENLPGRFVFVVAEKRLRLEWRPAGRGLGGVVAREVSLP